MKRFRAIGVYLTCLSITFYLAYNVTEILLYLAFSISCLLLGTTLIVIPYEEREVSFIKGLAYLTYDFYADIEKLLKEFDANGRGVYTPVNIGESKSVRVLIPMKVSDLSSASLERDVGLVHVSGEDVYINLIPMGFTLVKTFEKEGIIATSELSEPSVQDILSRCLVDLLEICRSVDVALIGRRLTVTLNGPIKEFYDFDKLYPRTTNSLGSPYASIIASIVSYITENNVKVVEEEFHRRRVIVRLEAV